MPRTPDAISLPPNYGLPDGDADRPALLDRLTRDLLGGKPHQSRDLRNGRMFLRLDPNDTLCFPAGSKRQGEERYDWHLAPEGANGAIEPLDPPVTVADAGPGVEVHPWVGYLKDGARREPGPEAPEVQAALAARIADLQARAKEGAKSA